MPAKKFMRFRYASDSELNSMIAGGFVVSLAPGFDEDLKAGMGLVLARFDEDNQHAVIQALGIVRGKRVSEAGWDVEWIRVTEILYPNRQGVNQWRKLKPYFIFAPAVVERYGLVSMFNRYFQHLSHSTLS